LEEHYSKKKAVYPWQELAVKICKELKVPPKEQGNIFRVCKIFPLPFVEHAFNETRELAAGDLRSHYFIKVLYSKK
jgi:hypothetical protein